MLVAENSVKIEIVGVDGVIVERREQGFRLYGLQGRMGTAVTLTPESPVTLKCALSGGAARRYAAAVEDAALPRCCPAPATGFHWLRVAGP